MTRVDPLDHQRHLKLIAQLLAMLREMVSRCLNAVVYVNGFDLCMPLCRASQ